MDQSTLVTSGQTLVRALDASGFAPRLAIWVHYTDTDTWKLWLVPPIGKNDKAEFYRTVASVVSQHRSELGDMDASETEMISDTHPVANGLRQFIKMPGLGNAQFSGNRFKGYYLPDGIILRSDL